MAKVKPATRVVDPKTGKVKYVNEVVKITSRKVDGEYVGGFEKATGETVLVNSRGEVVRDIAYSTQGEPVYVQPQKQSKQVTTQQKQVIINQQTQQARVPVNNPERQQVTASLRRDTINTNQVPFERERVYSIPQKQKTVKLKLGYTEEPKTYKQFKEREGVVSGTLSFTAKKVQGVVAPNPDREKIKSSLGVADVANIRPQQTYYPLTEAEINRFTDIKFDAQTVGANTAYIAARTAPYFIPYVGPSLLIAEGTEAYGTKAGRERLFNPYSDSSTFDKVLPAVQIGLGAYTLSRTITRAVSLNEVKQLEKAKIQEFQGIRKQTEAGGVDVFRASKETTRYKYYEELRQPFSNVREIKYKGYNPRINSQGIYAEFDDAILDVQTKKSIYEGGKATVFRVSKGYGMIGPKKIDVFTFDVGGRSEILTGIPKTAKQSIIYGDDIASVITNTKEIPGVEASLGRFFTRPSGKGVIDNGFKITSTTKGTKQYESVFGLTKAQPRTIELEGGAKIFDSGSEEIRFLSATPKRLRISRFESGGSTLISKPGTRGVIQVQKIETNTEQAFKIISGGKSSSGLGFNQVTEKAIATPSYAQPIISTSIRRTVEIPKPSYVGGLGGIKSIGAYASLGRAEEQPLILSNLSNTRSIITPNSKLSQAQPLVTIQKQVVLPRQNSGQSQPQIQTPRVEQIQPVAIIQQPRLDQVLKTKEVFSFPLSRLRPRTVPQINIRMGTVDLPPKSSKKSLLSSGKFPVQIRRGGKFKTVAFGRTPKEAASIGANITAKTLARTFRLPKSSVTKVSGFKSKASKKFGILFIEPSKKALSKVGEIKEIQFARRRK